MVCVSGKVYNHPATFDQQKLLRSCDVLRTRRSGPGGQHRNKVATAVRVRHRPTGVQGEASERRSQAMNLNTAVFRLRVNLAISVRMPIRAGYAPSDLWRSRCVGGCVRVNARHKDFPSLLAEALDVVAWQNMDMPHTAQVMRSTASQLVKLLRQEPSALMWVNACRITRGLRRLV